MAEARRLFGTDGVRGTANIEPMTSETALRLGRALAHVSKRQPHRHKILIGKDTRLSGYMLETAMASGICSAGVDVLLVGPLPTPGIAFLTRSLRADAGVVISASHNPFQDNGIKLFSRNGFKLPDEVEAEIEALVLGDSIDALRPTREEIGKAYRIDDAVGRYNVFAKNTFPRHLTLDSLTVAIDCAHGAGYKVAPEVLEELGARVVTLGVDPDGHNINRDAGALHPEHLQAAVRSAGAHIGIATPPVFKFGSEDQKQRYLAPAIRAEKIAALAITEPDAGSDVASIRTHAHRTDGGWIVNGSKMFITNGVRADYYVTAVKTTQEGGHQGISFLIVDKGEGVQASPIEKLGWHASDTALVALDDVFVPDENLLGGENRGFYLIMANFQWERLSMALGSVAAMQDCFDRTLVYAKQREAFGRPIGSFQAIRHKFAEMATRIEAGRALTYHALRLFVDGRDALREVTEAKLLTQRAAFDVADTCLQIHGGAGYMVEYPIERAARDARLGPIGGGTDEIMREILGRTMGL